jgi:glycine/D-amino acid oxidase-like deaminating enzyme
LNTDIKTDILIIWGGIIGSIANYYLSQKHNVVIVDKSRFGQSCTSCATALLEYQLDDYASDLVGSEMTEQEIVECYKMGLNSIKKIDDFIKKNGNHCEFALRPTLMYSDKIIQSAKVQEEYEFRKEHGFDCELLDESNNPFPFKIKKGLFCKEGGCEFNPYLFTKQMIENSKNQKQIFENTEIK